MNNIKLPESEFHVLMESLNTLHLLYEHNVCSGKAISPRDISDEVQDKLIVIENLMCKFDIEN